MTKPPESKAVLAYTRASRGAFRSRGLLIVSVQRRDINMVKGKSWITPAILAAFATAVFTGGDSLNVEKATSRRLYGLRAFGHDGKEIFDTQRYKTLGNSVAVPCVEFVLAGIATYLHDIPR